MLAPWQVSHPLVIPEWLNWPPAKVVMLPLAPLGGISIAGTLLTFHYVALGWVWFALPNLALSLRVFAQLFGLSF